MFWSFTLFHTRMYNSFIMVECGSVNLLSVRFVL